jgi:hypothetical protein
MGVQYQTWVEMDMGLRCNLVVWILMEMAARIKEKRPFQFLFGARFKKALSAKRAVRLSLEELLLRRA